MMDAVALPADVVARFHGKTMAITGYESDQVFVTPGESTMCIGVEALR